MQCGRNFRSGASAGLSLLFGLSCTSCLDDPDPEPVRRALQFETLASPSAIAPDETGSAEVTFLVGPNGCWRVEWLTATLRGSQVVIDGGAIDPQRSDGGCTDLWVLKQERIDLPPLAPGSYEIVAGLLRTPLVVTAEPTSVVEKVAYQGTLRFWGPTDLHGSGCAYGGKFFLWLFTGLPLEADEQSCVIQGEVTGNEPCSEVGSFDLNDFNRVVLVTSYQVAPTAFAEPVSGG